jgi:response regulator NasT
VRIVIVDENRIRAQIIEDGLRDAGHCEVLIIHEMASVMRQLVEADPDVVFIDLENPNRDMLEYMFQVSRAIHRPVAMFVDRTDSASIEAAIEAGVSAYVVDGLKKERVKSILETAIVRHNAFERMRTELASAKSELAERKLIAQAKALLMKSRGLSEPDAYALLRKTAMNQSRTIAQVAESLVTAAGLLGKGEA